MQSLRLSFTTFWILSALALPRGTWQIPVQAQSVNNNQANELLKQADFFIESNQFLAAQTRPSIKCHW